MSSWNFFSPKNNNNNNTGYILLHISKFTQIYFYCQEQFLWRFPHIMPLWQGCGSHWCLVSVWGFTSRAAVVFMPLIWGYLLRSVLTAVKSQIFMWYNIWWKCHCSIFTWYWIWNLFNFIQNHYIYYKIFSFPKGS